ncbi:hypothetical protein CAP35_13765 [Chitinophagaceae bacterium IBVUCB1]|nr:hypothetical protein CAP35_13765 [Chitinophagaceae bacterium IBVUCB1]
MAAIIIAVTSPSDAKAQVYAAGTNTANVTTKLYGSGGTYLTDTVTIANAGSEVDTLKITEWRKQVTFLLNTKKNTGTVAGTWVIRGGYFLTEPFATIATINLTDASNTYHYTIDGNPFLYYELTLTTTGTQNSTHSRRVIVRN